LFAKPFVGRLASIQSVVFLLSFAGAIPVGAQYTHVQQEEPKTAPGVKLDALGVKTGLYMFSSEGSNSLLRLTGNGLILVDGQPPAYYDVLRAGIRRISDQPVLALILTDYDEAHTATNAKFLEAGARIIAQDNLKPRLAADNPPEKGPIALITYDHDYQIHLGGVEAQLFHFGSAHSNSDTVVYFPNLKVVAVGDLYSSTPRPDFSAGGSLVGWGPVLAEVLKLDFDVAVPGFGPPVRRADLEAFKNKIDRLVSRASDLVKKGVAKDQLMMQLKTDDLGWQFSFTGESLDRFYAELTKTEQGGLSK
jgi:cyclase